MTPQNATGPDRTPPAGLRTIWRWMSAGLMVLAVGVAWSGSFGGVFVYDDPPAIVGNASLHRWWTAFSVGRTDLTVSGRPLANFSLALNYALGGVQVQGYHAVNLLIHLLAGAALFGVVRRTLGRPALRGRFGAAAPWLALATAMLWVVHPLQTESVTYVVQRVESLMGLFYLLTLYCFIRSAESPRPGAWQTATVLACLAGMASKEVMASAPLLVWIYDRTFFAGSFRTAWQQRRGLYVGLAATWLPLLFWMSSRNGTVGFGGPVTGWEYALIQTHAIFHYLFLAFWPHPLVFDYGIMAAPTLGAAILPGLLLLALAVAVLMAVRQGSPAGCAGAWFGLILAPSSSFVPVGTESMAEHRMYLPLAAVVLLLVLGLYRWLGLRLLPFCALLSIALALVTARRNADYGSQFALWSDTAAKQPDNARADNNLGTLWLGQDRLTEAERCFREAVRLQPNYTSAHYNLGIVLSRTGRDAEAVEQFLTAIRLEDGFVDARVNLGKALLKLGRAGEAVQQYQAALRLEPASPDVHYTLGLAWEELGRAGEAAQEYATAIRLDPQTPQPRIRLAALQAGQGDVAGAERSYREAIRLQPGEPAAHLGLGDLLVAASRFPEAIGEYQAVLRLDPDNLHARYNLGNVFAITGRIDDAIAQYEETLRRHPGERDVQENLRQARAMKARGP